jgi:hypothetical protein
MWTWLTRRFGPAATTAVALAWLLVSGGRARARHEAAWRALRERDAEGLTRFQREAEAQTRAILERHGVAVVRREVERGVWASGGPALSVTLYTSRPALTVTLGDAEAAVLAAGVARTAEEWDTPSPDDAFTTLLAALAWGVRATEPPASNESLNLTKPRTDPTRKQPPSPAASQVNSGVSSQHTAT